MGRPKGSKNKKTLAKEKLEQAEDTEAIFSSFTEPEERSQMVEDCINIVKEQLAEWEHELTSQE